MNSPSDRDGTVEYRMHIAEEGGAIAELRWLLKTEDETTMPAEEQSAFAGRYLSHFADREQQNDTIHWVAALDGSLIGVMTVRTVLKEPSPDKPSGRWGYVTNCFVRKDWRNRGHGTALLTALTKWARQSGLELLVVWPSERSRSFYLRAGFTGDDDPMELDLSER